ncbi:DUF6980 family protein [Kordiimonas lacus]|uniref:DUF6980 domain-containing protein n=1 Tax=Kordiimonas lacus TaxID=637679 RepID=A0A1G7A210_9PROT|nr:hypothetical protein [Kordiimonas lacus]SDE07936.1 hypothetical protein SAMN04488071_2023 [Kordiimonas lacus]
MEDLRETYQDFFYYLDTVKVEISYLPKFREFLVNCVDADSGILLKNCPWSGKAFPSSLRDKWFELLEEMNLEAGEDEIPEEFLTDEWWKKRGL